MESKYKFIAQDMETMNRTMFGTSGIRRSEESFQDDVLCLGQLKTLFGEPLYITDDLEDQFAYCILALTEEGKEIYLHVYGGSTGPAIGGKQDKDSRDAADALAKMIVQAHPSDYEYEGYYWDGPTVVREGIRNGVPYRQEEELAMPIEERKRLYEEKDEEKP